MYTFCRSAFVYFFFHNHGRCHACIFLIKHPIYNDWTVNWYACLCKLCMTSVAILSRENLKVLMFLLLLE